MIKCSRVSKMELYEKIRGLREDHDLTQKEVAEVLNTSTQYYQKYEKGIHPLPVQHLRTLCLFYHVSADDLLDIPHTIKRKKR